MNNTDEPPSRSTSVKRVRSISASLKGLFKPAAFNDNSAHKGKEHHESSGKPDIPSIRTHEVSRHKSLNENGTSKLSKISNEKVMELHKTRGNNGVTSPINKGKFYLSDKDSNASGLTTHSAKISPNPRPVDISPIYSPLPNIRNNFSNINHKSTGNNTAKDSANISPVTSIDEMVKSPMSPVNFPNLGKLSLSDIPSNLLAPEDSVLSENDLIIDNKMDLDDYIIGNHGTRKDTKDDNDTETTDSVAATPTDLSIDRMLENNNKTDPHLRPHRSRSLHKTISAASSIQSSVSSIISTENSSKTDDKKSVKHRAHAESFSASNIPRFQHNHSGNNSSIKSKEDITSNVTCILQIDNFKVFSNGTHEHNLKMINLVSDEGKSKTGGVFSIAGFFKSSHKNVESVNDTEFERPKFDNALSLIPTDLRNLESDSSDESLSSASNNEDKEGRRKKKKAEKNLPEIINPKAAVSSEELKLITTLSDKIHSGLKNARRNKKEDSRYDNLEDTNNTNSTYNGNNATSNSQHQQLKKIENDNNLRFLNKYGKHLGIVGHGSYGIVSVSTRLVKSTDIGPLPTYCKDNKLYFGVKQLKPRNNESAEKFSTKITSEFIIGHSLSRPHKKGDKVSPNILKILDLLEDNNKFVEVMEFCPSGDLYSLLTRRYKNGGALHPLEADCFMKQLLHGIKYMHDRGVAHCDLKPENILFHPNGLLKIADFGTSCVFQTAWEKHVHFQAGAMGSEPYVAPEEFIKGNDYDPRLADCWSIGVVYCTMVLGRCLWKIAIKEKDGFYNSFIEEMINDKEFYVFEELRHINHDINRMRRVVLYKIFHWNPEKRISINQILQSPWMKRTRCCIPYKI